MDIPAEGGASGAGEAAAAAPDGQTRPRPARRQGEPRPGAAQQGQQGTHTGLASNIVTQTRPIR